MLSELGSGHRFHSRRFPRCPSCAPEGQCSRTVSRTSRTSKEISPRFAYFVLSSPEEVKRPRFPLLSPRINQPLAENLSIDCLSRGCGRLCVCFKAQGGVLTLWRIQVQSNINIVSDTAWNASIDEQLCCLELGSCAVIHFHQCVPAYCEPLNNSLERRLPTSGVIFELEAVGAQQ